MKLYLVQHGKALDKSENPRRPLSEQGRDDVEAVASFLKRAGVTVRSVEHSGKDRAAETAAILGSALAGGSVAERSGIAPNDPIVPFVREVNDLGADVMVVGHLPFMAKAVATLIGAAEETPPVAFEPGGVLCIERDDDSRWTIAWMVVPTLLRK